MRRRNKIIAVASMATLFLGFNYWQPNTPVSVDNEATRSGADYFFRKVNLKQFNAQGKLASQLAAEKMAHYRENDHSIIDAPDILFNSKSSEGWHLTSHQGYLEHQTNLLKLEHEVRIFPHKSQLKSMILAQNLTLDLEKKMAKTDSAVTIQTDSTETTALGMSADFDKEEIHLISDVITEGKQNEAN